MNTDHTIYIVTAVDHGAACSGKAVVIGAYESLATAGDILSKDIKRWAEQNNAVADYSNMTASNASTGCSCCWRIHEQTIC